MTALFILLLLQIGLGAFDTFCHHDVTEHLTRRPAAVRELRLHGPREMIYGLVFAALGWSEWHGALAWLFAALLAVEIVLTLCDFLVEDRTRVLPPTERVTHTLLAINYGAVLALLAPELLRWAASSTGFLLVDRGLWSWLMAAAAIGLVVWGLRDSLRAVSLNRPRPPAADLVAPHLPGTRSILITGGTGFIGGRLAEALIDAGHHVAILTRDKRKAAFTRGSVMLIDDLDKLGAEVAFDAIVNLAGEPHGRWTAAKKRKLLASRLAVTESVLRLIARSRVKPQVLVSGSAIGIYEEGVHNFSRQLCAAWEACARGAECHGVRVVLLRTGIVLDADGGPLGQMLLPFELGLGGRLGDGRQWMSWIHRDDLVALIARAIADKNICGPLDATAPEPVSNAAFAKSLGRALRRPALLPLPAFVLRALLGQMADELMLTGPRVLPSQATAAGFTFRYPTLDAALTQILRPGSRLVSTASHERGTP
jgi:uncharacterized protein